MFVQPINDTQIKTITSLIQASGGQLVGRTRLQKMVYLLEVSGFVDGFDFEYRHYGPYSEDVTNATYFAQLSGAISEDEREANWGGRYSIYRASGAPPVFETGMQRFIDIAANANPVALELAATAVFVAATYNDANPWERTAALKPEKTKYLETAKMLFQELSAVPGVSLPSI